MSKLALFGGAKTRKTNFPPYLVIGEEEKKLVLDVFESNVFSRYLGAWHEDFYGGPQVRALEEEWADYFGVKHAISVNSATSGLYAAVGAIGIEPFDEVIVSPYTMSASATAPLIYNAIPVFADIEEEYFCLDVNSIESRITKKTRAIIVVDIFGLPYDIKGINQLANKYNLMVIEDCAQAPYAKYKGKFAGTLADIGIYSLNYHKHIHSGEGGVIVTDNDELANRLRLIRNHAEAVVEKKGETNLTNMLGFNFRMTEIEAAITRAQLPKLKALVETRQKNVEYLEEGLESIPALTMPKVRKDSTHSYYLHAIRFDEQIAGISRARYVEALKAELMPIDLRETEGIKVGEGYVKPLYMQPLFKKKIAYGTQGFPWSHSDSNVDYSHGICPVVEKMFNKELITHELMRPGMDVEDLNDVIAAFCKVWSYRGDLK